MSKVETKNKKSVSRMFYRYSECFKEKVVGRKQYIGGLSPLRHQKYVHRFQMDKKIRTYRVVKHSNTAPFRR